jgi:hypothetical protein
MIGMTTFSLLEGCHFTSFPWSPDSCSGHETSTRPKSDPQGPVVIAVQSIFSPCGNASLQAYTVLITSVAIACLYRMPFTLAPFCLVSCLEMTSNVNRHFCSYRNSIIPRNFKAFLIFTVITVICARNPAYETPSCRRARISAFGKVMTSPCCVCPLSTSSSFFRKVDVNVTQLETTPMSYNE